MAGRGPAPKDASKRARRNADPIPMKLVQPQVAVQPELPEFDVQVKLDGELVSESFTWPTQTRQWWTMLAGHPLVHEFFDTDWHYLLETARLHAAFWLGDMKVASELRLREAKYGFTPEDRARLRIQVAQAAESEVSATEKVTSARERMKGVRKVL